MSATISPLSQQQARAALLVRDLSDPEQGSHAIQLVIEAIEHALRAACAVPVERRRLNPVVAVSDNYDRLGYPAAAAARDSRYSRYLTPQLMLRSHTSAVIPPVLDTLPADAADVVLSCPGLVYRRDVIDRSHVGEPHQLDVWRIRRHGPRLEEDDLDALISTILQAALPGVDWRVNPATHPYTSCGREVEVATPQGWVEVGECGLAHPDVLAGAGMPEASGLASGWGLDRLVMCRKGVDDIRLLRSTDPRVARQMGDLEPYEPVSAMPAATRDLSIAVDDDVDAELLGGRIRDALGNDGRVVEDVRILSETPGADLPEAARQRLGLQAGQRNVLLRVVLRDLERTLTTVEANRLRDRIYRALHQGSVHRWTSVGESASASGG